ncbi:restriction endonuclease subunit S [Klebsiella aerogenes]|uniref:restriction endonuclease subunit S n=1 Tax=Klebsiella aerogenes TaxID=548 RepID=UPI00063C8795|nr:restriction endonuclease subunit S [Klebsiella aerogenes]ATX86067.1 restriction endonuclease subunit S [Klebsiella aerogenes]EJC6255740.1 restriction endonuclease subunit S [Klebsiella aerogenes]EKZ5790279.1 restriction endonuclease subunit S [Klebsiella aerogenes]ELA1895650.1 restriction endonuclease subunit S [Klebsiella aerogenes]KLE94553.1 restriction endonuclease EcoKI subunit S [Klebsiella aerogenes]
MSGEKLPEGWIDTQLGNIVDYGKATKRVLSDVNDDTWVLELEDIEKESSKLLSTIRAGERPFKSTKNSFKKGDVLYGKLRPYLNKIIIAEEDGVCTTEIVPLSAEPSCCNKYIFYWLKSSTFLGYVNDVSYGVNMPRLGTADGLKAPLRLAPLAEQKIIAEKLDTLLAQVDSTKARLEQIPQILKRFRQAVLVSAIEGKLTTSKITSLGKLGDIAEIISGVAFKKSQYSNSGSRLLQITNVSYGETSWENPSFIPFSLAEEYKNYSLIEHDIVLALNRPITNGRLKVTAIKKFDLPATLYQRVARIRTRCNKIISTKFLLLVMHSPFFLKQVEQNLKGSDQPYLNTSSLYDFKIFAPSITAQHEIVRRVEQLFAYADTIEKQVNNALTRVNSLTQSILAKAFRGELTAQWRAENPDLISGENSAAELLEKIKAERAASGGKKTSRKKA